MSFEQSKIAVNKAIKYINEIEELAKDPKENPSQITFNEDDDRIVSCHLFYIKEQFALKNIYEEVLKTLQEELGVVKITGGNGSNGEGILTDIQKWKDIVQINKHKTLLSKTRL